MTRGTLYYYVSPDDVVSSVEFNGDMYVENGVGTAVIKNMQHLKSKDDFKKLLKFINTYYGYNDGEKIFDISKKAIKESEEDLRKWIASERRDLKGNPEFDPDFRKTPVITDITTWQFWGTPNLSDYTYFYNADFNPVSITCYKNSHHEKR